MKKIISLILAFTLLLVPVCLSACGSKNDADNDAKDENGGEEKKVLTMATNAEFPPYEYYDGDTIVGIDAEIAALIAEKLGMELEIVDTEFDSIIPGVQSGKYDMGMAGMTVDETRLKSVNFSDSYAKGVQVVIIAEDSSIATLEDISGKKIGVQTSTTGDIYATGDYGEDAIVRFANGALAVEALKSGKVDCVIIDNEPAKSYVKANEGLKILDTEYAVEDYAICFNKNDADLQKQVNDALAELIADGSVQKIIDKYITAE
ncbi:MAG: transporter substrate-binding domain-containing protein [Clostridia bacterium]|nr:transporter substrate-binding domain-containing protein [Clostridia bacterium]